MPPPPNHLPWGKVTVPSSLSVNPYPSPGAECFLQRSSETLVFQGLRRVATWQLCA